MKPSLLVLGGGYYQLPLIHAAHRRGLSVMLLDGDEAAPGFRHADAGEVVDISDIDAVTSAARRLRPAGIASIACEACVRSTAVAARELGLPGIDVEVARVCTDKVLMRRRLSEAGLPCPPYCEVRDSGDAARAAKAIGFPLVMKPADNSGSRGVHRVASAEQLEEATRLALSHSRQGRAIAEGFLDGVECTVETYTVDGATKVLGISDKVRMPSAFCVAASINYPGFFDPPTMAHISEAAKSAIAAVGLADGPGHLEMIVTRSGPMVVDLAARGGGFRIFSDIVPTVSGVDGVEAVLDFSLGSRPRVTPAPGRAAVIRFFNPGRAGTLHAVEGVDAARAAHNVHDVVIAAEIGARYGGIARDGDRPGYLITVADTREAAVAAADRAEKMVRWVIS